MVTHHNPIYQGTLVIPQVGVPITPVQFGDSITLTRITNARYDGKSGYFPDYSKRQAWNANETKLMLRSGNGAVNIFDAQTHQFLLAFPDIEGVEDIFWHPTDPQTLYYFLGNELFSKNVQTSQSTSLHTFSSYAAVYCHGEGNLSNDGHYVALCAHDGNDNPVDFLVYDLSSQAVVSTLPLNGNVSWIDWISISPLGNYVIVDYATDVNAPYNGVEVYDRNFNFLWRKPLGAGHSDYGLDANGAEVLIMDVYDPDSNVTYINKYVLSTGNSTRLLGISPEFDLHESCRATDRPGWVYVSTFDYVGRLTDDSLSWMPFEDEVFALKMDGSGDVERYAHHRSRRFSPTTPDSDHSFYFAEPHATPNRSGAKVLFGSNWRINLAQDTSVNAYVIDLSNFLNAAQDPKPNDAADILELYPNPTSDRLRIQLRSVVVGGRVDVLTIHGAKMDEVELQGNAATLDISKFPRGTYLLRLRDRQANVLASRQFVVQ